VSAVLAVLLFLPDLVIGRRLVIGGILLGWHIGAGYSTYCTPVAVLFLMAKQGLWCHGMVEVDLKCTFGGALFLQRSCEEAERKLREERLALDKQKRVFEGKAEEGDGVLEITLGKENYRCLRFAKKRSDF
jgi:hypothetical protein